MVAKEFSGLCGKGLEPRRELEGVSGLQQADPPVRGNSRQKRKWFLDGGDQLPTLLDGRFLNRPKPTVSFLEIPDFIWVNAHSPTARGVHCGKIAPHDNGPH